MSFGEEEESGVEGHSNRRPERPQIGNDKVSDGMIYGKGLNPWLYQ